MADLDDIRAGIKVRLQTITALNGRTLDYVPESITPPMAVVGWPKEIDYDEAMGRGLDQLVIPIRIYVSQADNRGANAALSGYLNKAGATSVKAAIEGDRKLGNVVQDSWVPRMTGAGAVEHGGIIYLSADWDIEVLD